MNTAREIRQSGPCPTLARSDGPAANGSHYTCSTHGQGGEAACPVASCISRSLAEDIVLEPVQPELLASAAVEHACEQIRGWARKEHIQIAGSDHLRSRPRRRRHSFTPQSSIRSFSVRYQTGAFRSEVHGEYSQL
jgi:hypothetical protein